MVFIKIKEPKRDIAYPREIYIYLFQGSNTNGYAVLELASVP